jgi:hypothetical protein
LQTCGRDEFEINKTYQFFRRGHDVTGISIGPGNVMETFAYLFAYFVDQNNVGLS